MKVMINLSRDCITALFRQAGGTSHLRYAGQSHRAMTAQSMIAQIEAAVAENPHDVLALSIHDDAVFLRLHPSFMQRMRRALEDGPVPAVDL